MHDLLQSFGFDQPRQVRGGIATICRDFGQFLWRIPVGQEVVKWWLKQRGWSAEPSDAGLIATRLVHALGGVYGLSAIGHKGVVELLNSFTRTNQRLTKSRHELLAAITEALESSHQRIGPDAQRLLEILIEEHVLRVGLEIQCPVCRQRNWYPPGSIGAELECERCLARFPFPSSDPPTDAWRYRPVGPFAIEDFAHGAYSVALALRFFLTTLHGEASWSTGLVLRHVGSASATHLEVDAALFWTQRFRGQGQVLFVEAKSFATPVAQEDVDRAKQVMEAFPEAIYVFAVMKPRLNPREKHRLRKLLKELPDHHYHRFREFKPVLILTGVELFSLDRPPECWKAAGAPWSEFGEGEPYYGELGQLCEASQRLHLAEGAKPRG